MKEMNHTYEQKTFLWEKMLVLSIHFSQNSKVQTYEEMWKVMSRYLMESNEQGYTKVMEDKGEYAFILEGVFNDYLSQQKPCKTMPTGGLINNIDYGIAINRKRRKELGY